MPRWTAVEDERLCEAYELHGDDWEECAAAVRTRSARDCARHWRDVLDPTKDHSALTADEIARLARIARDTTLAGSLSRVVEEEFPTRRARQCMNKLYYIREGRKPEKRASRPLLPPLPSHQSRPMRSRWRAKRDPDPTLKVYLDSLTPIKKPDTTSMAPPVGAQPPAEQPSPMDSETHPRPRTRPTKLGRGVQPPRSSTPAPTRELRIAVARTLYRDLRTSERNTLLAKQVLQKSGHVGF